MKRVFLIFSSLQSAEKVTEILDKNKTCFPETLFFRDYTFDVYKIREKGHSLLNETTNTLPVAISPLLLQKRSFEKDGFFVRKTDISYLNAPLLPDMDELVFCFEPKEEHLLGFLKYAEDNELSLTSKTPVAFLNALQKMQEKEIIEAFLNRKTLQDALSFFPAFEKLVNL